MKIAILGAGSLGIIIGALIKKNGYDIDLIDPFEANVKALNEHGATITGYLDLNVSINAYTPNQLTSQYDLIILLTKQTTTKTDLESIKPHLHQNTIICTLQNGIPEEFVASLYAKENVVGGAVGFGATWKEPGVSELTSTIEAVKDYAFEIGEIDGSCTERIQHIKEILSSVGQTTVLPNLMGVKWTKLLMNATFSGMSAALGCTFGEVLDNEKAMICVAYIADETIRVCEASGYQMVTMNGLDMKSLKLDTFDDIENKLPLYRNVWEKHRRLKASMLQDLEKQRPCEVDFINGVVTKVGREKGIKTPFNDRVVELIKEAEKNHRINDFSYLDRFDDLIRAAKK